MPVGARLSAAFVRAIRLAARAIGCGQYARALMGKVLRDAGHSRVGGDFPPPQKKKRRGKKCIMISRGKACGKKMRGMNDEEELQIYELM